MMSNEASDAIRIGDNLLHVRRRIRVACEKSGRSPDEVALVAVSKLKPFSDIEAALTHGVIHFGENYVQELSGKMVQAEQLPQSSQIRWHMIGHLQKNKVKYLVGRAALIHSVDSVSLAEQIEKEAAKKDQVVRILLEVNIAREESKWGFSSEDAVEAARQIAGFPHVRLLGLMTSAPMTEDPETNRPYFRSLRLLAQRLSFEGLLAPSDPEYHVPVLSMGMTGDFEVAVEEGATMIRVGTAIFGQREKANGGK